MGLCVGACGALADVVAFRRHFLSPLRRQPQAVAMTLYRALVCGGHAPLQRGYPFCHNRMIIETNCGRPFVHKV